MEAQIQVISAEKGPVNQKTILFEKTISLPLADEQVALIYMAIVRCWRDSSKTYPDPESCQHVCQGQ